MYKIPDTRIMELFYVIYIVELRLNDLAKRCSFCRNRSAIGQQVDEYNLFPFEVARLLRRRVRRLNRYVVDKIFQQLKKMFSSMYLKDDLELFFFKV